MINKLPVLGWIISFILNTSLAVPFWFIWTYCEFGSFYFGEWIPQRFESIPVWNIVGLFIVLGIFRHILPTFIAVNNSSSSGKS